jgi:hypothetical protein
MTISSSPLRRRRDLDELAGVEGQPLACSPGRLPRLGQRLTDGLPVGQVLEPVKGGASRAWVE